MSFKFNEARNTNFDRSEKLSADLYVAKNLLTCLGDEIKNQNSDIAAAKKELDFQNNERKKKAQELNVSKQNFDQSEQLWASFLSIISHQIRIPMSEILGFYELLKSSNLSTKQREGYIQIIQDSGQLILRSINDIINISKIELNLVKVNIMDTNINEQLNDIYNEFKSKAELKGLKFILTKNLSNNNSIIRTDQEKILYILTILVENAFKYTGKGSIEIGYVLIDKYLKFYIKDTGVGIELNNKNKIYNLFNSSVASNSDIYTGIGTGLSISKFYVELLGGKLNVDSAKMKGTTFFFTLPNVIPEKKISDTR